MAVAGARRHAGDAEALEVDVRPSAGLIATLTADRLVNCTGPTRRSRGSTIRLSVRSLRKASQCRPASALASRSRQARSWWRPGAPGRHPVRHRAPDALRVLGDARGAQTRAAGVGDGATAVGGADARDVAPTGGARAAGRGSSAGILSEEE